MSTGKVPVRNYMYSCKSCNTNFQTANEKETLCLACRIKSDCKLSDDTIINMNLVKLWEAKKFHKEKGMDPMLVMIAEGSIPLSGKEYNDRNIYTTLKVMSSNVLPDSVESYVSKLISAGDSLFDVIIVIRFSMKSNFHVYTLDYSKKTAKLLENKDTIFKKKLAINIINNHFMEKS